MGLAGNIHMGSVLLKLHAPRMPGGIKVQEAFWKFQNDGDDYNGDT